MYSEFKAVGKKTYFGIKISQSTVNYLLSPISCQFFHSKHIEIWVRLKVCGLFPCINTVILTIISYLQNLKTQN